MTPEERSREVLCEWIATRPRRTLSDVVLEQVRLAIADERQACARLVETWADDHLTVQPSFTRIAAAIRARP